MRSLGLALVVTVGCGSAAPPPSSPFAHRPYSGAHPITGHDVVFPIDDPRCAANDIDCRDKYARAPLLTAWRADLVHLRTPNTPVAPQVVTLVIEPPVVASAISFELRAPRADGFTRSELLVAVGEVHDHIASDGRRARAHGPLDLLWVRLVEAGGRATAWLDVNPHR